jgi:hypothetical protein
VQRLRVQLLVDHLAKVCGNGRAKKPGHCWPGQGIAAGRPLQPCKELEREDAASMRREKRKRHAAVLGDELDAGQPGYVADRIISVLKSKGLNLGQAPR